MGKKPAGEKPAPANRSILTQAALDSQGREQPGARSQYDAPCRSAEELLHELRVHQTELEMQNETLRDSQFALEKSRDRYADLYDYAPVGYIAITPEALIGDINLTGAALLGVERNKLLKRRFENFVASGDRDQWHQIFMHAQRSTGHQKCELEMQRGDGSHFFAQFEGLHRVDEGSVASLRMSFTDITQLKEADERYRKVFELASDGIVITDAGTGRIIEINRALADMFGQDKSELIGKSLDMLFKPEVGGSVSNAYFQRSSVKHGAKIAAQFVNKSGQINEVEIKMSVVTMLGREVEFGIARDITERHQAQAREHRLRHILDHTMDMIFIFKPDTLHFVYMNRGAVKGVGYGRDEMLGMTPVDVIPLISEPECRAFIFPLVSGKKSTMRFETLLKRRDGRTFPVEAQLQLVKEEGDNGLFVAIARDITRRKQAEDELRKQKNLMWQVIDMDPNMIFVKDESGRFLLANQAIADYYGMKIRNLIGKTNSELSQAPHGDSGFLVSDRELIESGKEVTSTESAILPDGKQHWYLTVKRPILQVDGSINTLGIAADISDLKRSGSRLDESYKELQRLALHLENVRAEERALIARNLHDEMGATLAALKMRIAWLASKLPAGMPLLEKEVGHISDLVSDGIHTVRQVVSELRPNLLDDVGLIAAVQDYTKKFQRDTEIECNVVLPEHNFMLDENQSVTVFRIIQESLSNVAKHAQASKADILFELHGEILQIHISDNGIGFEPSCMEQSFGLIGIRERALMIGGTARIESKPGQGTRVSLTMTCKPARPADAQSVAGDS